MEGLEAHESDGEVRFAVRVQPRASRNAIEGVRDGALRIRLTAPPVEGEANEALVRLLAARLNVPKSAVRIVSGERGRTKRVAVRGVTAAQVRALLRTDE
ncbi:MAG TPA: DUF167 domain-containing protein [Candidatus Acidoferrales bacterium]|nr:DUF167 domain-containing protein [Candidatus Acidoferrales bacterium]